ncbi:alkene reductase [Xanthomonas campestris pv. asclepiadis]|uniref:alkene reductase n=1 Tax=Xanthomonas campestris TaxID=339 RepID=UPI001E2AE11A|nr:alkene reductase [Xanthomonas campestris]MCC4614793.1 alkene reductase [Xanthomonas campestris pv. asclepiadis]
MTSKIFQPFDLGDTRLSNRIVMAPMTRARNPEYVANALTATYYAQRASAGLIVSEGTPVSQQGQGYIDVPGIWSQEQVAGWKVVTDAVHVQQGNIFAQLWHVGRMSHTSLQPNGADPVSASTRPVASSSKSFAFIYREDGTRGTVEPSPPRALETEEVPGIVRDFEQAAQRAIDAGFDGIEIHAANGYLFEQFLNPITNDRVDAYGGSLQNRARLILETVDAVAARIGSGKVGIRLAPNNRQFDMPAYAESEASYLYLAEELAKRALAYVHLNDNHANGSPDMSETFLAAFKRSYGGTVILAGKLTLEWATRLIDQGVIDLAAFGQPFIANPDLVARLQTGVPLATPDRDTYYGGGAEGYTDYPAAT